MFTAGFSVPFQIIRIPGFSRRVVEFHSGIFRAVEFYSWRWRAEEMTIGSKTKTTAAGRHCVMALARGVRPVRDERDFPCRRIFTVGVGGFPVHPSPLVEVAGQWQSPGPVARSGADVDLGPASRTAGCANGKKIVSTDGLIRGEHADAARSRTIPGGGPGRKQGLTSISSSSLGL